MRKFTFYAHSLKGLYQYGLVYNVAGIFDFMSSELEKGNTIVFLDVSAAGNQVEHIVESIDELLFYYDEMIAKARN